MVTASNDPLFDHVQRTIANVLWGIGGVYYDDGNEDEVYDDAADLMQELFDHGIVFEYEGKMVSTLPTGNSQPSTGDFKESHE